jgi:hypothetical protein
VLVAIAGLLSFCRGLATTASVVRPMGCLSTPHSTLTDFAKKAREGVLLRHPHASEELFFSLSASV